MTMTQRQPIAGTTIFDGVEASKGEPGALTRYSNLEPVRLAGSQGDAVAQ
jgi:hypothetical protein